MNKLELKRKYKKIRVEKKKTYFIDAQKWSLIHTDTYIIEQLQYFK